MKPKYYNISFIQIISALLIVNHHTKHFEIPYIIKFTKGGFIINTIFVFLSGYLLTKSYEESHPTFAAFILKRIKRIYPPLILSLILTYLLYDIFGIDNNFYNFIITLTGFQYFFGIHTYGNHLWFISIILICYILTIPSYYLLRKNNSLIYIIIFLIIGYFLTNFKENYYQLINNQPILRLIYHYLIFILGIKYQIKFKNKFNLFENFNYLIVLLIFIGSIVFFTENNENLSLIKIFSSIITSFLLMQVLSLSFSKFLNESSSILFLSNYTYEIYLVHFSIIVVLSKYFQGKFIAYLLTYILTILLAIVINKISISLKFSKLKLVIK